MRQMVVSLSAFVMACSCGEPMGPTERGPQVPPAVASVTIEAATSSLVLGTTHWVKVIVRNAAGHELASLPIAFTSSNERIVSVERTALWQVLTIDGAGLVRALAEGTATLTATSEGISGRMTIQVLPTDSPWDYDPPFSNRICARPVRRVI